MKQFAYKICDTNGNVSSGIITAFDKEELAERFRQEGKLILKIKEKNRFSSRFKRRRKISLNEMIIFNQELIALLQSGIPADQAIGEIAGGQSNKQFKTALQKVRDNITAGMSLSDALSQDSRLFPMLYIALVNAGEKTGDIIPILERYLAYQEKIEEFKDKIFSALAYPVLLSIVLIAVLAVLFVYVVPNFIKIYIETDVKLPFATQLLISATKLFRNVLLILIPLAILSIPFLKKYKDSEKGRHAIDRLIIKSPFFGSTFKKYLLSRFLRTLHTLLKSGIPFVTALDMSYKTVNNSFLEEELKIIRDNIKQGETFGNIIAKSWLFSGMSKKLLITGDRAGQINEMLEKVAFHYEKEVDRQITYTVKFFEPVVMIISGLLVALVVIAMYLPVFKLGETIK